MDQFAFALDDRAGGPSAWIWPLLLAPFIGSFIGVIVLRLPTPWSVVVGRSACPHCGQRLGVHDLIPLASWLAARGHCRHCGASLGLFYPGIELAALAVAIWAAIACDGMMVWVSCLLGWTLLALAACDGRWFVLPDSLSLPLLAAGLGLGWWLDPATLVPHAIGAAAGFLFVVLVRAVYWQLRGREGIGLGDAKLLAAAGAWLGWAPLPSVLLIGALSAITGVLVLRLFGGSVAATDRVPFGAFLCLGLWIVWLYGALA